MMLHTRFGAMSPALSHRVRSADALSAHVRPVCHVQARCSLFMFISGVYAVLVWKKV